MNDPQEILSSIDEIFLSESFGNAMQARLPWGGKIKDEGIDSLFSWDLLNDFLFFHRVQNDRLRLSVHHDFAVPNKKVFAQTKDGLGRPSEKLHVHKLHEALDEGATAVLEAINESFHHLNTLVEDIYRHFSARSTVNAYFSFGNESGFGPHNDDHDVIVVQLDGRKKWTFFSDGKSDYASAYDLKNPNKNNISFSRILARGDMIYLPKGVWHDVSAIGEPSLHVTIGMLYPSIAEFIKWLLESDKYGVPYMDIRPFSYSPENHIEHVFRFLEGKCTNKKINEFLASYHSRIRMHRIRPDVLNRSRVNDDDILLRVPSVVISSEKDQNDGKRLIRTLGDNFYLDSIEVKILACFDKKKYLNISEIESMINIRKSKKDMHSILSNLIEQGLLTKSIKHALK